jgi:hypothetical protein
MSRHEKHEQHEQHEQSKQHEPQSDPPTEPHEPLIDRATEWLNNKLFPYIGPPALGPYDKESTEPVSDRSCPICGYPMGEHRKEESDGHVYLHHPDGDAAGVMEVG